MRSHGVDDSTQAVNRGSTLRALEDRWENNEFFRKKRDVAAFHVDADVIDRGLDELIRDGAGTGSNR